MLCPSCHYPLKQNEKSVLRTISASDARMPIEYRGLNIVRRERKCFNCKKCYHTVELLEDEFLLLKKPKVLTQHQSKMRHT